MLYTFYQVMLETLKLLSPFIPFVTEESIHLSEWPEVENKLINKKLEEEMEIAKKIIEASNSIRHEKNIKLRYVLSSLSIGGKDDVISATKNLKEVIEKMANVKDVKIGTVKEGKEIENGKVSLDVEIIPELKNEWLLSQLTRSVQETRKKLGLEIKDKITLYLKENELFKESKEIIEGTTGSKVIFGEILGKKSGFEFENKKYEFGIKV